MENIKIYKFADDGSLITAVNPQQVVEMMRRSSRFASDETIEAYMEGFVDRYRIDSGNSVRCDTAENFVADLLKFGFLTEV